MRQIGQLLTLLALVAAAALAGCSSTCPSGTVPLSSAPVAAAPCAPAAAASPCAIAAPAPQFQLVAAQPIGVEYHVGAVEQMRAGIAVPPQVAVCLTVAGSKMLLDGIQGIQCALNALIPTPTPTATYVFPQLAPPQFAPAAAPCTPPPALAPPCAR